MIAPNGKKSNLTNSQYKLVRTTAFKDWFGDWENNPSEASNVVDENGEPLVVYHGRKSEFNEFDKTKIGFNTSNALRGFYFSDNSSVAHSYTYDENEEDYLGDVIEVFLYANKMKTIDADNKDWVELSEKDYIDEEIKKAFESGYDCVMVKNIADPFIDMDNGTDYYGNTFVVDNPNQIKLADGTNTTFDSNNNDIRFDEGGNVKSQNLDTKLKDIGFEFNSYIYRYGKKINEDNYITAFYSKKDNLYKIRGTHKYKTPLGENSVGIQFDFENEKDFFEKINDMSNKFKKGGLNELKMERGGILQDKNSIRKYAENLLKDFDYKYTGYSESNYGNSMYFDVDGIKCRFSDHTLTNRDRMINEINFSINDVNSESTKFSNNQSLLKLKYRLGDKSISYGKISYLGRSGRYSDAFGYTDLKDSKMEQGGDIKFNGANTSLALFQELSDKSFLFPKDTIYLWLYEGENAEQKLDNGEYDWVLYPFSSLGMMGQRGFIPPIKKIWTTKFQNKLKGADNLLGVIKAELINDGKGLFIDIMSVNPKRKKQGIMSYMIKYLRDTYNLSQEQIEFSDTTDDGRKFVSKKTYEQGGNINFKNNNMSKHKDGLFVGKSHKEGGIPLVVKSTGQRIEVEGGESITNKTSMADDKIRTLTGTNCEIISQINSQNGNGVAMDCDSVVGKKYEYKDGGMIYEPKFMHPTNSKMKSALKNDFNINFKQPNIYYPKQSLGFKRNQMPQIRKQFLPILFETLRNDGIKYEDSIVSANTLKPSQNEINIDLTKTMNEEALQIKTIIVSSDNYVIDGHHRWYYAFENNIPVKITKIDLPIEEALNYIRQLDFIEQEEIAKRGMLVNSQKSLFGEGGNIEVDKYSEQIPMSIYEGVIGDFDNDSISNADDLEPNVPSKVKLEEISFKDELTDIIKYRNLFVDVQKKVLSKIKKINTCGKIQCEIKTRIKTPYSIINKLRRRSLTDVKTLDKLDKKAKEFLKNKDLKGIDLYKGLTDILGFMVIVEDFNFLNKLKAEVEAGNLGEVLEFEDFYKNDLSGYRAYHFLLSTEINGTFIPYELQLRTMRVNELAEITHTIYKQGTMNSKINDKIAKEIELADKGNNAIAKIIDKKLENKDLLKNQLTIKKLAFGDIVASGFLSSYKYKVRNDVNKLITSVTEYADNEAEARKDLYRKYKNFTLLAISVNDGDYVPISEYVENKKDRSQIDLFDTEQRFEYAREMKKGGVIYRDLSTIKPQLVMESEIATPTNILVDEVSIVKTGEKFVFNKRKISSSNDSYDLLKDFWNINNINVVEELNVILLDKQNKPISIYRHSKGGIDATIGDIEVISAVAVKTLAKGVIMSHNHPSGSLVPSPADLEISKQLKNALKLFNIVLLDSLIVTETDYYSMADNGVFKLGGHIDSDCDCSKCRVYDSTIIIDEADTKKGKMFLIKLRDLYYIIYDDEIVLESSELKYAKKEFESNLYYDKLRSKNTFAKGGMITDAEYSSLEKIVPKNMLLSIKETKESWERGDSDDIFEHYENLIEGYREIPNLYFQDEKGFNSVVYLHYFYGGGDWYITELDKETNEAYGYVILNGDTQNSAFGYMNLNELTNSYINLDLYWSFKTLNEIFENKYPELVDGEIEYYNKDATLTRLTNFEVLIEKNDFKNQYEVNQFIELMIDEKLFESNNYTTIEKSFLQRYSGMGGLQKYGATGKGILWEYYTPKKVADIMWALAYKHKSVSKFDRVLENSVGIGTFVNSCPLQVGSMDCYDISKYAIAICTILYGNDERFQFFLKSFETLFFIGNSSVKGNVEPIYDLVIGNPPYSEYSGKYAGLGEKNYTKATNYIDYFIFRSLDLLKSGGLLVYILGSIKGMGQDNWLESKDNYTKEKIKEKAELVDALRLGSGVFEFTDVDSDIIVLRKK